MKNIKYLFVRYYKDADDVSEEDTIVKYFYSEEAKRWIFEKSWSYETMLKRIENIGNLKFIDEFYNFIQDGKLFAEVRFTNMPIENYVRGDDIEI